MKLKSIVLASLSFVMAGCSTFHDPDSPIHDRRDAYVHAQSGKQLKFPPDLREVASEPTYEVAEVKQDVTPVSLTPPGSFVARVNVDERGGKPLTRAIASQQIRIQQREGQWGLLIRQPVAEAEAAIESALTRQAFKIVNVDKVQQTYQVSKQAQHYQLQFAALNPNSTYLTVKDEKGRNLNDVMATQLLEQLTDGLKGKKDGNFIKRLIG